MKKRIALLGIYHETNTFIERPTTLDDFRNGYWLEGQQIVSEYRGAHHEISGVIDAVAEAEDMELVPVLYVAATPGGIISVKTYEAILTQMWDALAQVSHIDGYVVVPHGAGVAEKYPDMDGHWLSQLREKVGEDVPIIGTLDPHANVSPAMAKATNALTAYGTNPHIDQYATGLRAGRWMVETLRGKLKPIQKLVQLPLAISIEQQYTSHDPCKSLLAFMKSQAAENDLVHASLLLGFPYADVPEMGSSFLLIANGLDTQETQLEEIAEQLTAYVLSRKSLFNGKKTGIGEVYEQLSDLPKPILLLDMGDNVGGGALGNSTHLIEFFEKKSFAKVFTCLADPAAVEEAFQHSVGERFGLDLTTTQGRWHVYVTLRQLSDGIFKEDTPKHGGFVNYNMGSTAIVETDQGNILMLTARRTPPYSLRQMTAFGLEPAAFEAIIAKGVNAPIAAYSPVCPAIVQVDTPGATQADMTFFTYHRRRKPLYPFEDLS